MSKISLALLMLLQSLGLLDSPQTVYYTLSHNYAAVYIELTPKNSLVDFPHFISEYWYDSEFEQDSESLLLQDLRMELRGLPIMYIKVSDRQIEVCLKAWVIFERVPFYLEQEDFNYIKSYQEMVAIRVLRVVEGRYGVSCIPQPEEDPIPEPSVIDALPPAPFLPPETSSFRRFFVLDTKVNIR